MAHLHAGLSLRVGTAFQSRLLQRWGEFFWCCSQIKKWEGEPTQDGELGERLMSWHKPVNPALCDILLLGSCRGAEPQRTAKVKAQADFTESKFLPTKDPAAVFWPCSSSAWFTRSWGGAAAYASYWSWSPSLCSGALTGEIGGLMLPGNRCCQTSGPTGAGRAMAVNLQAWGADRQEPLKPQGQKVSLCVPAGRHSWSCEAAAETRSLPAFLSLATSAIGCCCVWLLCC